MKRSHKSARLRDGEITLRSARHGNQLPGARLDGGRDAGVDLFWKAWRQLVFKPGERGIASVRDFLKCACCKPFRYPGVLRGLQEMSGMYLVNAVVAIRAYGHGKLELPPRYLVAVEAGLGR